MNEQLPSIRVPVVTGVAGGSCVPDDLADWEITGFRDVTAVGGDTSARYAIVPIEGDSMESQRIFDGDYVLMQITRDYRDGRIGIWQTPSGRTAKFAHYDLDGYVVLHNDNGWRQTWQRDEIHLLGLAVRVERDLI